MTDTIDMQIEVKIGEQTLTMNAEVDRDLNVWLIDAHDAERVADAWDMVPGTNRSSEWVDDGQLLVVVTIGEDGRPSIGTWYENTDEVYDLDAFPSDGIEILTPLPPAPAVVARALPRDHSFAAFGKFVAAELAQGARQQFDEGEMIETLNEHAMFALGVKLDHRSPEGDLMWDALAESLNIPVIDEDEED